MQFEELGELFVPQRGRCSEAAHCGVADEDIFRRMEEHSQGDMILEEDDGPYEKGDILWSFHHQARRLMSQKALLADFFIGLVEEMCGAISFWRHHSSDCLITSHSSSPWSFPWTPPSNGVLYSAGPSCVDGGFL